MIKKIIIFFLTILLLFTNNTRVFASNHFDEFKTLDNYLESALKKANIPGASLVVVNKDKILFQNTYGNCKNINDLFIIGSMSKSFTALTIMQLVE